MKIYREKTDYSAVKRTVELVGSKKADLDRHIYVFCESRTSLAYELALANAAGGTFGVEVLSFARYISLRLNVENYLPRAEATLIVRRIIEENADSLIRLKKGSASLAENVYNLISGLKSAKISVEDLKNVINSEEGALKSKLADIVFIYERYNAFVKDNGFTDESGYLSLMPELLRSDKAIRNSTVIISGISNLTKQTVDIILTLEKLANLTFVTVSYDAAGYTNEIFHKLLTLFGDAKVYESDPLDECRQAIADGLFNPLKIKNVPVYSDKVHILEYSDIEEEAEGVARRIRYETVNNKKRYRDFSIACQNVDAFAPIYEKVFKAYEIPLFADRKRKLSMHPVIKLFADLLDFKKFGFKPEIALKIAKNPMAFNNAESSEFERYLDFNTPSRKMLLSPFENIIAESVRFTMINSAKKIPPKGTVTEYVSLIRSIFSELNVEEKLLNAGDKLADIGEKQTAEFNRQAKDAFDTILEQTERLAGSLLCDAEFFKSLVLSAVESTQISVVASYNDNVFLGDMVSAKQAESKILFVVGLDADVPSVKSDTALLCDRELLQLGRYKCIIEPTLKAVNKRERQNVLTTLLSFEEQLYISYSRCDLKGAETGRSEVVDYMQSIFGCAVKNASDLKKAGVEGADENYFDFLSAVSGAKSFLAHREAFAEKRLKSLELSKAFLINLKDKNAELYHLISDGEEEQNDGLSYDGGISATLIETYFSCPYKAFGERILKLTKLSGGDAEAYEIGLIFHSVFDKFVNKISLGAGEAEIDDTARELFRLVIADEKYSRYLNKKKYEYIFSMMEKEAVRACRQIYDEIKYSDFKPMGTEICFGDYRGATFKAIEIPTFGGIKKINGFIDRADRFGNNVKIVDYKTGSAADKVSEINLYSGNSIQLYLYMNALKSADFKLAAAHYFMISDAYGDGGDSNAYFGNAVADTELVSHIDGRIASDASPYNIHLKKDGNITARSSVLGREEFDGFVDYAKLIAASGAEEMQKGLFFPTPYTENACENCSLKGMCGYDAAAGNRTRRLSKVTAADIMQAVEEEKNAIH